MRFDPGRNSSPSLYHHPNGILKTNWSSTWRLSRTITSSSVASFCSSAQPWLSVLPWLFWCHRELYWYWWIKSTAYLLSHSPGVTLSGAHGYRWFPIERRRLVLTGSLRWRTENADNNGYDDEFHVNNCTARMFSWPKAGQWRGGVRKPCLPAAGQLLKRCWTILKLDYIKEKWF